MKVGVFSLERRQTRGDIIEMYRITQGVDRVDKEKLFSLSKKSRTRSHPMKLNTGSIGSDKRNFFYTTHN